MADCNPSANSSETVSSGVRSFWDKPESDEEGRLGIEGLAVIMADSGGDINEEMDDWRERGWSL
jgi:hypothetical protein